MTHLKNLAIIAVILPLFIGCSSEQKADAYNSAPTPQTAQEQEPEMTLEYEMSGIPFDLTGKPVSIAGVTFTPAIQWNDLGPSDMKAASYTYGPLENDKVPAQLSVFYFGQGQGGTIEANVERWIKQMSMPDGSDPARAAIRYTKDFNGLTTHVVTLFGTFNESMGGPMSGQTTPKENYRLVGVIVEAPQGNVFFKLTGPDYTAKIMVEAFMHMIFQIQRAPA